MDKGEVFRFTLSRHALIMDPTDNRLMVEIRYGREAGQRPVRLDDVPAGRHADGRVGALQRTMGASRLAALARCLLPDGERGHLTENSRFHRPLSCHRGGCCCAARRVGGPTSGLLPPRPRPAVIAAAWLDPPRLPPPAASFFQNGASVFK